MLDGLAHAHAHGIVHRDVEPANVLLEDGERIHARLSDFGLAQFEEAETLTAQGDVPGTLAYISPERLHGKPATPAAGIWAVGVLLWEALAARHPFLTGSPVEMAKKIEAGAPPLHQARPDLPEQLVKLVARALAPDPGRRPAADRLAAGLRRAVEQAQAAPRPRVPFTRALPSRRSTSTASRHRSSQRPSQAGARRHCRSSRRAGRWDWRRSPEA